MKSLEPTAVMIMEGFPPLWFNNPSILVDSFLINSSFAPTELYISLYQGAHHADIPLNLGPQVSDDPSPMRLFCTINVDICFL